MNCGRTNQVNFFSSFLATISLHFFCECNCFYSDNQLQWKPINCVKCSRCLLLFCRFIRNIFSCLLFRLSIKFVLRFGSLLPLFAVFLHFSSRFKNIFIWFCTTTTTKLVFYDFTMISFIRNNFIGFSFSSSIDLKSSLKYMCICVRFI